MLPRSWGPGSLAVWRPGSHLPRDIRPCSPSPQVPPKSLGIQQAVVAKKRLLPHTEPGAPLPHSCLWRDPMTFNAPMMWSRRLLTLHSGVPGSDPGTSHRRVQHFADYTACHSSPLPLPCEVGRRWSTGHREME